MGKGKETIIKLGKTCREEIALEISAKERFRF
jgi:hypothetical protein